MVLSVSGTSNVDPSSANPRPSPHFDEEEEDEDFDLEGLAVLLLTVELEFELEEEERECEVESALPLATVRLRRLLSSPTAAPAALLIVAVMAITAECGGSEEE